jgi:hypothetical protein
MIKFNINGIDYDIRNQFDELTVNEFEKIAEIQEDDKYDNVEKYINTFMVLGVKENDIDELSIDKLYELIKLFNNKEQKEYPIIEELSVNKRIYKLINSTPTNLQITTKDLSVIEKLIKQNQNDVASTVLAVLYKDENLTKVEHYDKEHLKYKKSLFKNCTYDVALPLVLKVLEMMNKTFTNA